MKDEEIDFWYDEQKEKLQESLTRKVRANKNKEHSKKIFSKRIKELHTKYEKLHENNIKHESFVHNLRFFFKKSLFSLKMKLSLLKEKMPAIKSRKQEAE